MTARVGSDQHLTAYFAIRGTFCSQDRDKGHRLTLRSIVGERIDQGLWQSYWLVGHAVICLSQVFVKKRYGPIPGKLRGIRVVTGRRIIVEPVASTWIGVHLVALAMRL